MFLVHDIETTIIKYKGRVASPFHPDNFIVYDGYLNNKGKITINCYKTKSNPVMPITDDVQYLVGFNYKFDLMYLWNNPELKEFFKRGGRIWDCQYAEYLLEGQSEESRMCSLNSLAEKYGGTQKIDAIKEFWKRGVCTTEIPEDLIKEYLEYDLKNTEIIFKKQVQRAKDLGMLTTIKLRMDGLLATTEMEYNGLYIDYQEGIKGSQELLKSILGLDTELVQYIPKDLPPELVFNWGSNQHLSAVLFGGTVKYFKSVHKQDEEGKYLYSKKVIKEPILDNGEPVLYKSGKHKGEIKYKNVTMDDLDKPKTKIQPFGYTFKSLYKPKASWCTATLDLNNQPFYSTSEDILTEVATTVKLAKLLVTRKKLIKDRNTYYIGESGGKEVGMLTMINEYDNLIHHNLNHTITVTSRLSSSSPNLQNVPRSDTSAVKKLFISRFKEKGKMLEIDYSQLEVIVKGVLANDDRLLQDLRDRIDFHCKRVAAKHNISYEEAIKRCKTDALPEWVSERTACKMFSFQRAYGAGAETISVDTGIPLQDVQELIKAEDSMYPGVVKFDTRVMKEVQSSSKLSSKQEFIGGRRYVPCTGKYRSPTGTMYTFYERPAPDFMQKKGVYLSYSPTETKNYPTQGFGGEIVQTMVGILWRYVFLKNNNFNNKALMVNTVHDCVWFDVKEEVLEEVAKVSKQVLESVPRVFNKYYSTLDITVPFPVDAEQGDNLYKMKHI